MEGSAIFCTGHATTYEVNIVLDAEPNFLTPGVR